MPTHNYNGITVVNRRIDTEDVYIGRGSPLGNPFTVEQYGRDRCIELYREWLLDKIENKDTQIIDYLNKIYLVSRHRQVKLGCYCKPKSCHGDVIKEIIDTKVHEMNVPKPVIAFTGHRPNKLYGYDLGNEGNTNLKERIKAQLIELNPKGCISGMALGVDTLGAMACNELGIKWSAAIPFKGQECRWPMESQKHYYQLLDTAHSVHVISEGGYSANKMQIRNQWMVDNCNVLLAVWNGSNGGTGNCVAYANSIGKTTIKLNP